VPAPLLASLLGVWEAVFSHAMTRPSFSNLLVVAVGWVMTDAPIRTITETLLATSIPERRHHEAFHRLFSRGTWDPDHVGHWLLQQLLKYTAAQAPLRLVMDDTVKGGKGAHVFGLGTHIDAVRSTKRYRVFIIGHCWVVLAVLLPVPFSRRAWALPVLFRLYRNKKECAKNGATYRKKTELAREMIDVLCGWVPGRRIELTGDSAYCNDTIMDGLPDRCVLIGTMRPDAVLTAPPPPHTGVGRPRRRGDTLPKPEQLAKDASTPWQTCEAFVYGRMIQMRYKMMCAQWYRACGTRLLRIVVVATTKGTIPYRVFFSTDPSLDARTIAESYAARWGIEVFFRDAKQLFGFADSPARKATSVLRMVPFVGLLYSTLVLWFIDDASTSPIAVPPRRPWYRHKRGRSFADVLRAARKVLRGVDILDPVNHPANLDNNRAPEKPPGVHAADMAA